MVRSLFTHITKYQQRILLPALVVCLISCAATLYCLYYITYVGNNLAAICNLDTARLQHDIPSLIDIHRFNRIVPWFLFGMTVVLSLVICRLYYISNKLLGPSERILKELDQMLSGERKDPVGTRPGDEIFEELFKRINPLLKRIQ